MPVYLPDGKLDKGKVVPVGKVRKPEGYDIKRRKTIILPLWKWILLFSAVAVITIVLTRFVINNDQATITVPTPVLQIQDNVIPTLPVPSVPLPTEVVPTTQTEMPCIKSDLIDLLQSDQSGNVYVIMTLELGTGAKFLLVGVGNESTPEDISWLQNHYGMQPITLKVGDTFGMTGIDITYLGPSYGISGQYCQ